MEKKRVIDKPDYPEFETEQEEVSGLRRWSQRKAHARSAPEMPSTAPAETELPQPVQEQEELKQKELTDADMPPLESLDEKSDLSPFFSPKVSASLRRLALRKIFHLPVYNIRDGLNDYDEDYTTFEPLGDVVTADMRHMQEVEEKRRLEKERLAEAKAEQSIAETPTETEGEIETELSANESADEQLDELDDDSLDDDSLDDDSLDDDSLDDDSLDDNKEKPV